MLLLLLIDIFHWKYGLPIFMVLNLPFRLWFFFLWAGLSFFWRILASGGSLGGQSGAFFLQLRELGSLLMVEIIYRYMSPIVTVLSITFW